MGFLIIIFIVITFSMNNLFKPLISLECKYNKLELRFAMLIYVFNKSYSNDIHSGAATPFSRAKEFRMYSAEELPEMATKAWKRRFFTRVSNESVIVNIFPFCSQPSNWR